MVIPALTPKPCSGEERTRCSLRHAVDKPPRACSNHRKVSPLGSSATVLNTVWPNRAVPSPGCSWPLIQQKGCWHLMLMVLRFSSVVSDSLQPHESQHARPPCPSPTPGVHSDSCPSSRWCHPAISSSVVPFSSCPQSLPASGSFPMSQLFAWGGQSIGVSASASVLPMNTSIRNSTILHTMLLQYVHAAQSLSHLRLFETPWTVALQAPLSMWFPRQRILEWVAISSSRESSGLKIEPESPVSSALSGGTFSPLSHPGSLMGRGSRVPMTPVRILRGYKELSPMTKVRWLEKEETGFEPRYSDSKPFPWIPQPPRAQVREGSPNSCVVLHFKSFSTGALMTKPQECSLLQNRLPGAWTKSRPLVSISPSFSLAPSPPQALVPSTLSASTAACPLAGSFQGPFGFN